MKRVTLFFLVLVSMILCIGFSTVAWAQASLLANSPNLTPDQWVGQRFVFLALPADKQSEGYEIFPEEQAEQGFAGDTSVRLPYKSFEGKVMTVSAVVPYLAGDQQYEYMVHFKDDKTGKTFLGRTMRGQLEGVVPEADLSKARQQLLGKTIYLKQRMLQGMYDPQAGEAAAAVPVKLGEAAQVLDVYTGLRANEPIWLIIQVHGQKAVLPIAYSWTNQPVTAWTEQSPWQAALFLENPRTTLGWSDEIWNQLDAGTVEPGMTKEQVLLSWGAPVSVDEKTNGTEQAIWNYSSKMLTFQQDVLQAVKDIAMNEAAIP
ncbi:hypothetical protein [Propionispora vibrioides]|uniref:Uncharacterized protein n=1 Tax=Propionispora vibrioides TaxID=112903 RepID=A0A1H8TWW1_9FIRM|nr:hypothetical protein [Propionispora vibrioides]SEO95520.1 hypothetical protein SAMN04490178_107145 [Propionispora vibrioides]